MSEDANLKGAAETPGEFQPAALPPRIDTAATDAAAPTSEPVAAAAMRPEIEFANVMPDGTIAVPQDTARRALEAVQVLVENNRSASQQLESLMGIVLDAAEVANRSAASVSTTGGHLNTAAEKLIDGAERSSTQAKLALGISGAVLVCAAGVFSFMTVQLQNKIGQLDEMMLAVGKRAVDLKRRMESMDDIRVALDDLKLSQQNTQTVQEAIEARIAKLAEAPAAGAVATSPVAVAAKPLSPEQIARRKAAAQARGDMPKGDDANRLLLQQLTALDGMLKEQSQAVKDLSGQFGQLQGSVAGVDSVRKDVEALAAQQRRREMEQAQELALEKARREKELKEKERELVRERERARDREAAKERELAREREASKERQLSAERDAERQRMVTYKRDQSKPASTIPGAKVPSFTATGGTKSE